MAIFSKKAEIEVSINDVLKHIATFPTYIEQSLTFNIIVETYKITDITELHDRLIGGTAKFLNIELITNNPIIQASQFVKTIW